MRAGRRRWSTAPERCRLAVTALLVGLVGCAAPGCAAPGSTVPSMAVVPRDWRAATVGA